MKSKDARNPRLSSSSNAGMLQLILSDAQRAEGGAEAEE